MDFIYIIYSTSKLLTAIFILKFDLENFEVEKLCVDRNAFFIPEKSVIAKDFS